jgi:hypothetical protein
MLRRIFIAVSVLALAAFVSVFSQISDLRQEYGVRVGRVVSRDTGEGVPDAVVVAEGLAGFEWNGKWTSRCTYYQIAKTDSRGSFSFPSRWSHLRMGWPFGHPKNAFFVFVSKRGYIDARTDWPLHFDEDGSALSSIHAWHSGHGPPAKTSGLSTLLPDLQLLQIDGSLKDRVAGFASSGLPSWCSYDGSEENIRRSLISGFYRDIMDEVCQGSRLLTVDKATMSNLMLIAPNTSSFMQSATRLDKNWASNINSSAIFYSYEDACRVLQSGA